MSLHTVVVGRGRLESVRKTLGLNFRFRTISHLATGKEGKYLDVITDIAETESLPTWKRQSFAGGRLRRPKPQYSWATESSCRPFTLVM